MAADERRGPLDPLYAEYAGAYDERTVGAPGDIACYREIAQEADGPVVELGVGTGHIAIPTVQAGVPCSAWISCRGCSRSRGARRWRRASARTWGDRGGHAPVRAGAAGLADHDPLRAFLHNLTTDDQLSTLACCRATLAPGGRLALNVFDPDLR